ncbi:hypothetical protein ACERIT_10565 [Halopenitus sp. H-Gu1]|uniref:hypothetical protein n=1 Tax=Halopenitus sp. H-Gu1 TaxID=3242697 RepID=UPI00359CECFD
MASDRSPQRRLAAIRRTITPTGWRPAVGFALVVLVVSIVPVPGGASHGTVFPTVGSVQIDPFVVSHFLASAILAALCHRSLADRNRTDPSACAASVRRRSRRRILTTAAIAVAIAAGYGAAIETVQIPVPWRSGGLSDAAINAIGALSGVFARSVRAWAKTGESEVR